MGLLVDGINRWGFWWAMSAGSKGIEWWRGSWTKTPKGNENFGTWENSEGKRVEMDNEHWTRKRQGVGQEEKSAEDIWET